MTKFRWLIVRSNFTKEDIIRKREEMGVSFNKAKEILANQEGTFLQYYDFDKKEWYDVPTICIERVEEEV